jgi:hypothetical protein
MVGIKWEVEFGGEFGGSIKFEKSIEFEDASPGGGNQAQSGQGVGLIWYSDKKQTKQQNC